MNIIRTVSELLKYVESAKLKGYQTGLVPTMGALHEGHLSLVKRSKDENDITIVSIFVNPTQFNNPTDLATYPRNEEEDVRKLAKEGADIVFTPSVEEIYPAGASQDKTFKLGQKAEVMEGKYRPGHFQGVAQIVSRLFELCRPTRAYFGMKDFQQIAIIREMIRNHGIDVEIVACPIVREENGLALSSRNQLLDKEQRREASQIHQTLKKSVRDAKTLDVESVREKVICELNSINGFKVEYFEIVDGETLLPVEEWSEAEYVMGCITVYVGTVRLIDNIQYKP